MSDYRYRCCDCGKYFDEPRREEESRGEFWGMPAYETMYYCPYCGGDFEDAKDELEDICQYTIDIRHRGVALREEIKALKAILECAGYEVADVKWKASWTDAGYWNGGEPECVAKEEE